MKIFLKFKNITSFIQKRDQQLIFFYLFIKRRKNKRIF
jgi:hypothetical protein